MKRKWMQFSLRSLVLLTTFVAVILGLVNAYVLPYRQEQLLLAELRNGRGFSAKTEDVGPRWLGWLGCGKYSQRVVSIEIGNWFSDEDLPKLREFRQIRTLVYTNGFLENGAEYYGPAPYPVDRLVNDERLAHLTSIRSLENLSIADSKITDEGLATLQLLPRLRCLDIKGNRITDNGLESLTRFPRLRQLTIKSYKITDQGLMHLGKLKQLESLTIQASVTDAGIGRLAVLNELKTLRCLHLYGGIRRQILALPEPTKIDGFEGSLRDIFEILLDYHGVYFFFDDCELCAKNVSPLETRSTLTKGDAPLRERIRSVLSPLGLDFVAEDDVFVVTTKEVAAARRVGLDALRKQMPKLQEVDVWWAASSK